MQLLHSIELSGVSKRFGEDWVFRNVEYNFSYSNRYALRGPNGSGKSTFLKLISGQLSPSKGNIQFTSTEGKAIDFADLYKQVSYTGPYIELIEEFSLREAIQFHRFFKVFLGNIDDQELLRILQFQKIGDRQIRHLSSGQKQRVKLALSIMSQSRILLLDEPSTNLDAEGMQWFQELLNQYAGDRLLIIASNEPKDFQICRETLSIQDYK